MTIRRMFPLLAVAVVAGGWLPADVAGQLSSCWVCAESPFTPEPDDNGSTVCRGWYWGASDCAQKGTPERHWCDLSEDLCWDEVLTAADELAVASVRAGLIPPIGGDHFVLTEGDDILVMRSCGAEIARFAVSELKGARGRTGLLAIGTTEGSEDPVIAVAATGHRRGILEE